MTGKKLADIHAHGKYKFLVKALFSRNWEIPYFPSFASRVDVRLAPSEIGIRHRDRSFRFHF